ncbi:MAG TPA: tetratricopeptide repeat protein [Thermoanaerobaculia bacterium]|nr:tetratricopeptide repeat protein [Thermoanaerobaculia bacterium]
MTSTPRLAALCTSLLLVLPALGRAEEPPTWQSLIDGGKCREAEALCVPWLSSKDTERKVEARKCLANAALCGQDVVSVQSNESGGGYLGPGYRPEAIEKALSNLNEGLKLAPQDLSIHQGRLHLLMVSGRFDEMAKALDESCRLYSAPDELEDWLPYVSELFDAGQYNAALLLLKVLDASFPNNHEVVANIGSVLAMQEKDEEALTYMERAVKLAPEDPLNSWNLARLYDYTGKLEQADIWYQKALRLETDPQTRSSGACTHAAFVETKLKDRKRACELQKANCPENKRTACSGQ